TGLPRRAVRRAARGAAPHPRGGAPADPPAAPARAPGHRARRRPAHDPRTPARRGPRDGGHGGVGPGAGDPRPRRRPGAPGHTGGDADSAHPSTGAGPAAEVDSVPMEVSSSRWIPVVASAAALAGALASVPRLAAADIVDRVVAVVEDDAIFMSDLERRVRPF